MKSIFFKEFNSLINSFTAPIVLLTFCLLSGLFYWVFEGGYNLTEYGFADLQPVFELTPWLLMLMIPALSMRSFAEEFSSGTIEILTIKPLRSLDILLGKWLAVALFSLFFLIIIVPIILIILKVVQTGSRVDMGIIFSGFLGLMLIALIFISLGILASLITRNQIIAYITGVILCFLTYYAVSSLGSIEIISRVNLERYGLEWRLENFIRGIIDTRDLIYLISHSFCLIYISNLIVSWKLNRR